MSKQTINNGSAPGDVTAESIYAAFGKTKSNFSELYDYRPKNVLDDGALGTASHSTGGGSDDTAELQAAIDAAVVDGVGTGLVQIPGNRTYGISSTLNVPGGITIEGIGGRNGAGNYCPPTIVWVGAAGGVPIEVATTLQDIHSCNFRNLTIQGRTDLTNLPSCGVKFTGTAGAAAYLDSHTHFTDVAFQTINGPGIWLSQKGATNFWIRSCRWDGIYNAYGIYVNLTGSDHGCRMTIEGHCTYTCDTTPHGFLHLDGEGSASSQSFVNIYGLHIEVGGDLVETYAIGTNPIDKQGLIRLGVTTGGSDIQHHIRYSGLDVAPAGHRSHSVFHVTRAGVANDALDIAAAQCVSVLGLGGNSLSSGTTDANANGEISWIGGAVPYLERPERGSFHQGLMMFHIGFPEGTGGHGQSFVNTRDFRIGGLSPQERTFADLPTSFNWAPMIWSCNNVNNGVAAGTVLTGANTGTGTNLRPVYGIRSGGSSTWYLMVAT